MTKQVKINYLKEIKKHLIKCDVEGVTSQGFRKDINKLTDIIKDLLIN